MAQLVAVPGTQFLQVNWFGLIGYPLERTLSPVLHQAALQAMGVEGVYLRLPVAPERLGDAVKGFRALRPLGINVTIPFKEAVIPFLDDLSPVAEAVGAVNTLVWERDRLLGDNTDALALQRIWQGHHLAHVLVLGTGGAARAACWALGAAGARQVTVVGRTAPQRLMEHFQPLFPQTRFTAARTPDWRPASLIVNATPVDWPVPHVAVPYHDLRVYPSDAVQRLREQGVTVVDGRLMLVHQAALALEKWLDRSVPIAAMAETIGLILR